MTKPVVHRYLVVKKTFCGLNLLKRKSTVSSFWEEVNCKKCIQQRKETRRQLSYWRGELK